MKIVTVIPLTKGAFKENLTYFTSREIADGNIVSILLRNKKILGLVVATDDVNASKGDIKGMDFNLKKIVDVKERSIWSKEFLDSIFVINKYFASRISDTIASLIPNIFREEYDKIAKFSRDVENITITTKLRSEKLLFQASFEDRISYYKTMIRGSFAEKKSVFIVLPSELDISDFKESLSKGIEDFTHIVHGSVTPKKLLEKFEKITKEPHPILVLGTAPFLSIPRRDLGIIVLEHESSNIYKMMTKPYIDLRSFAEIYASKINAKFILGDTLLRFETIEKKSVDGWGEVHPLSFRINFDGKIEILGKESILQKEKKFQVLLDDTINKIQNILAKKKSVFIFSFRKGLATMTVCRDCNQTLSCEVCMAPVVLYLSRDGKKRIFSCNRCKREIPPETKCANCGSWNLVPLGIGTDTVYEEVKKHFPKVKMFKLDKEIAKTKTGAKKIVKEFEETFGSILIGTEMAFFYMKERVPLSIIASFDSLWSIPNYKMGEKIIQIILSMISKTEKEVIIQTKNEKDPAILAVTNENLLPFVREELKDRKTLNYPPYKRFIKITHLGNKDEMQDTRKNIRRIFEEYNPEIFSGFIAQSKNMYSTNILIKLEPKKWSVPELSTGGKIEEDLLAKLSTLPPSFKIEIDPEDLL